MNERGGGQLNSGVCSWHNVHASAPALLDVDSPPLAERASQRHGEARKVAKIAQDSIKFGRRVAILVRLSQYPPPLHMAFALLFLFLVFHMLAPLLRGKAARQPLADSTGTALMRMRGCVRYFT